MLRDTMEKKFLTVNVKLQKEQTIKYKIVNRNSMKIVDFPEEELIEKTKATFNAVSTKSRRAHRRHSKRKSNILKKTLNKRKVLKEIQTAIKNYKNFPLNQIEYVQLLWDAIDKIEEEVQILIPIINSSTHNNLMRCLYMILVENNKKLIELLEYEVEPISQSCFEKVCKKLMDNVLTCNRVLLACCYVQNSYQKVNKPLENLIVLVEYFEMIVAFVAKAILQSEGTVQNYNPSGHIIRHLRCSLCDTVVSLAGCYCTNWTLDTLSAEQATLFMNPAEDGPVTSSSHCIKSWDVALYYLRSMPPPEAYGSAPLQFASDYKTTFVEAPLRIRDIEEERQPTPKPRKRKAVDTIDEVWLKTKITGILDQLHESPEESEIKRKAGNNAWLVTELNTILDKIPPSKSERFALKRKAEETLEDVWLYHQIDSNESVSDLLGDLDAPSEDTESDY